MYYNYKSYDKDLREKKEDKCHEACKATSFESAQKYCLHHCDDTLLPAAAAATVIIRWPCPFSLCIATPLRSKNCWRTAKILTSHHSLASYKMKKKI